MNCTRAFRRCLARAISAVMLAATVGTPYAQVPAEAKPGADSHAIARLWIQASDGAVRHRDLVKPSMDSLIAMGTVAVPKLLAYLATEDARERHAITDIFQGIGAPAIPALTRVLGTGGYYHTLNTLNALGKIADSSATAAVLPFVHDFEHAIRAEAAETLGKTAGTGARAALYDALQDSVELVRKSAAVALGRLRDPQAKGALLRACSDPWFGVRFVAADALVQLDSSAIVKGSLSEYADRPLALILNAAAEHKFALPADRLLPLVAKDQPAVARAAARLLAYTTLGRRDRAQIEQRTSDTDDPLLRYYLQAALAAASP